MVDSFATGCSTHLPAFSVTVVVDQGPFLYLSMLQHHGKHQGLSSLINVVPDDDDDDDHICKFISFCVVCVMMLVSANCVKWNLPWSHW